MSEGDLLAVWLTLKLAASTTAILLLLSPPLAWWLSRNAAPAAPWRAMVALPLVCRPPCSVSICCWPSPGYGLGGWWREGRGLSPSVSSRPAHRLRHLFAPLRGTAPPPLAFVNMGGKGWRLLPPLGWAR